jgi:hypothetical protein
MGFTALGDGQGKEVVDARLAGVGAGLDDQRLAFRVRGAGVVQGAHNDAADRGSDIDTL